MAQREAETVEQPGSQRIQFNDAIKAVSTNRSTVEKQSPVEFPFSEKCPDINDEESAKRITENDLYSSRKQVSLHG